MKRWVAALVALFLVLAAGAAPVASQDRVTLGWGRLFSNDALGDRRDRWRSTAFAISLVRGPSWSGSLPASFGELLEFRARAEIISPSSLTAPPPGDRRYAGILTFGLHTHFDRAGWETSLGADLALTGPQTGLGQLQTRFHETFGIPVPLVLGDQIPDGIYPTLVAETGRNLSLGPKTSLRPYAEAQAGLETFVRVGADVTFGHFGDGALMLRDGTTGQRYRAVAGDPTPGLTFSLGGDVARVWDSALLPDGGAAVLSDTRHRLRAGLAWQGKGGATAFYGVTWLSPEFEDQGTGQTVGSLALALKF